MADVAPRVRERGQLILIGGLSLAVVFVALALVLNSAIYTENLATRTGDQPVDTAVEFRADALSAAGTTAVHVNRNGGDRTYESRYGEYETAVERWHEMHANYSAVNGLLTDVTPDSGREGTRVADSDHDGRYTSRGGQTDWMVAPDVQVRRFRLNVSRGDLASEDDSTVESTLDSSGTAAFYAEVDDGSNVWRVGVYRDADTGELTVMRRDPSGDTATCSADGSTVVVDLTAGTLDGVHCGALSFMGQPASTYDISYHNADLIAGTYELTVDRVEDPFRYEVDAENGVVCPPDETTFYDGPADGSPYATQAVYSATLELYYDDPRITYEATGRTAPGEVGDGAVAPTVVQFEITDADDSDGEFEVSWSVSDPDGDLDAVDVTVTNQDGDFSDVFSGASGTETITDGSSGDRFTVEVAATDAAGHGRSASKEHTVDEGRCPT